MRWGSGAGALRCQPGDDARRTTLAASAGAVLAGGTPALAAREGIDQEAEDVASSSEGAAAAQEGGLMPHPWGPPSELAAPSQPLKVGREVGPSP